MGVGGGGVGEGGGGGGGGGGENDAKKVFRECVRGGRRRKGKVNGSEGKGKGKQVSSRKLPEKRRIYDSVSEGENEHVQKKKKVAGKKE